MARFRLLGPAGLGILVALGVAHACYYEALNLENPADFYYRLCYAGCTHMDNKNNDYGQCCTPLPAGATAPALCTTLSQKVLAAGTTCQWGAVPTTDFPSTYSYATQPAPSPPAPSPSTQYGNNDKVTVWVTSTTTTPCAVTQSPSQPPSPPPSPSASYVPPQPAPSLSPSYSQPVCTCPEDPTYNHDKRNPRPPCSCDSTGMSAGSTQSESTVTTWTTVTTTSSTTVSMPKPLVSSISCSASSCPHVGDARPTDYKRMFVSEIRANPTANHDKRDFFDDISARQVDDYKLNARQQDVLPTVTTTVVESKVTTITTGGCSQAGNAYAYYTGVPTSSTMGPALITSTHSFGRREVQTYTKVVTSTSWSTVIKSTTCASPSGAPPSQPTCYCTQPPASLSGGPLYSHSACSGTDCPSIGDARPSIYRRGSYGDFARRGNGAAPTVCPCGGPKVVSSSGPTASAGLPPDPMNCACPSGAPGPNPSPSGGPLYSAPGCTTSGCATIGDARPSNYRRALDDLYARNQPAMNCACYPSTGMSAMPTQSNTGYVPQIISTCPCPGGPSGSPSHQPPAVPSPSPSGPMYSAPSCTTSGCATIGDARPSGWKRNGFWNRDVNHNTCACPAAQPSPSGQNQPSNSQPAPSGPSNKPSGPISYLIPSCSTSGCATIGDARPSDYKRAIPPAYITPSLEVKHKRGLAEARAHHAPLKGHKVEERATRPTDYVTEREFVEARHYNVTLRAVDEDLHVGSLMTRGVEKRNGQPETLTSTSWITTDDCKPTSSVYVHPSPSVPAPSPSVPAPSPSVPAPPPSYTHSPSASPSPSSSKGSTGYAAQPTSSASQNSEDCDTSSGSTGYAAQSTQSSKLYSVAPSSSGQPHIGDARPSGYDTDLLMQERRGNGL